MASPTRWGIVSAGKISTDFCIALRAQDPTGAEHRLQAVVARAVDDAKQFAKKHSVVTVCSSYEELAQDENIDIVYIGSIHTHHARLSKLMLNAGKPVLCEKPMGLTVKETKEVLELAKEKNLFFMEAIWSRHTPIYERIRSIISSGRIGKVEMVVSQFGLDRLIDVERIAKKEMGGGAILDIGLYTVQLPVMVFGTEKPKITIQGNLAKSGVDETSTAVLQYSNNRTAVAVLNSRVALNNEADIYGTKGMIKISSPFWCPTKMIVQDSNGVEVIECPLPKPDMKVNYVHSEGLGYQAVTARKCLLEGKLQSDKISHEESVMISTIMQGMRHGLGYKLPQEQENPIMPCQ